MFEHMDHHRKIELIDKQVSDAEAGDPTDFEAWVNGTEVVVRSIFGNASPMHTKITAVSYWPGIVFEETSATEFANAQRAGVLETIALLKAAKLELEITEGPSGTTELSAPEREPSETIFIVHGRDDARKYALSSFLQNLTGNQPVILHQQPSAGQVLIEKFESVAGSAGYSVVLLTADDRGRPKEMDTSDERARARQNVVFEMGFFFGLIGRKRVAVLYDQGVELPSDVAGIVYIPLDDAGAWKGQLASEISHAGLQISDWSAVAHS